MVDITVKERLQAWAAYAECHGPTPAIPAVRNSEAAAEIDRLERERDELDGTVRLLSTVQTTLFTERDAARAEVEALRKDRDALMEFALAVSSGAHDQDFRPWAREVYGRVYGLPDAAIAKEPVQVPAGECPYPIRQDHSIAACVEAGDCGCGQNKT